jgi:hypothetical protein
MIKSPHNEGPQNSAAEAPRRCVTPHVEIQVLPVRVKPAQNLGTTIRSKSLRFRLHEFLQDLRISSHQAAHLWYLFRSSPATSEVKSKKPPLPQVASVHTQDYA